MSNLVCSYFTQSFTLQQQELSALEELLQKFATHPEAGMEPEIAVRLEKVQKEVDKIHGQLIEKIREIIGVWLSECVAVVDIQRNPQKLIAVDEKSGMVRIKFGGIGTVLNLFSVKKPYWPSLIEVVENTVNISREIHSLKNTRVMADSVYFANGMGECVAPALESCATIHARQSVGLDKKKPKPSFSFPVLKELYGAELEHVQSFSAPALPETIWLTASHVRHLDLNALKKIHRMEVEYVPDFKLPSLEEIVVSNPGSATNSSIANCDSFTANNLRIIHTNLFELKNIEEFNLQSLERVLTIALRSAKGTLPALTEAEAIILSDLEALPPRRFKEIFPQLTHVTGAVSFIVESQEVADAIRKEATDVQIDGQVVVRNRRTR